MLNRNIFQGLIAAGLMVLASAQADELGTPAKDNTFKVAAASDEGEKAIKTFQPAPGLKIELFAAEPLLANPVCFSIDEQGRFYVIESGRLHAGVGDIRGRVGWEDPEITRKLGAEAVGDYLLNEELASTTVDNSIAFLKRHYGPRAASLSGNSDRVRLIYPGADGKAERSTVFADGFDRIGDGLAAGILAWHGNVWMTDIPDLWLMRDTRGTGRADVKKVVHHGFGVRVGFLGHDMHGLRMGPDGKVYFSIGDRGANVNTDDGRHVVNTEYGAVYRCNPDGTELEIFALGLRNPQELVFDKNGNLWTGDNNSDAGDPARWVYVVEGGDSGWRVGYQFIERPNARGPWLGERQCYPQWDGQAAFLIPPVDIIGNGPSGVSYFPGAGFSEKYNDHFLLCDFKGAAANSGVHSFAVQPSGAGFKMVDRDRFIWNTLVTDVDFGYDGSVYISDWVNGWGMTGKGRLYRIFDPAHRGDAGVEETKRLMAEGMTQRPVAELVKLLSHLDQRVRQEAQFALAAQGASAVKIFTEVAARSTNQLARFHAIWGLGQLASKSAPAVTAALLPMLADQDLEVSAQAARVAGDRKLSGTSAALLQVLKNGNNPRGQFFAALALGKIGDRTAIPTVLEMLKANADKDVYLRHAGVMALVWLKDTGAILAAAKDNSTAVRMASLLALRRLERPEVAQFLVDAEPKIALEAARAINDASIYSGLPQLAALATQPQKLSYFSDGTAGKADLRRPLLRRIVNANYRLGQPGNAVALASLASTNAAPDSSRTEALQQLGSWAKPSGRDAVTGLWRPLPERDGGVAAAAVRPILPDVLRNAPDPVRLEAAKLAAQLNIKEAGPALVELVLNTKIASNVRVQALHALSDLMDEKLAAAVDFASNDMDERLRNEATRLHARMKPAGATGKLIGILQNGTLSEQQNALATLGTVEEKEADEVLGQWLTRMLAGQVKPELQLDLLDAAAKRGAPEIKERLAKYEESLPKTDDLAPYRVALAGGTAAEGRKIFFERQDASCLRCHKIGDEGGEVGPVLTGVGSRHPREYLLESVVFPNKQIAKGFETVVVTLKNGVSVAGIAKAEDATELTINSPEDGIQKIKKTDIAKRESGLSGMPEGMGLILSKHDLRDLIEFLGTLK